MGHPVYQLIHPANIMYIEILIILCYVIRRMEPDFCVEKININPPPSIFLQVLLLEVCQMITRQIAYKSDIGSILVYL